MTAVTALTERAVRCGFRELDIAFAAIAPVLIFIGCTVALRNVIDTGQMSYPQYVLPVIVVQAMLFGALNTTDRAATEHTTPFGARLRTLPISVYAPLYARMLYCLLRGVVALVAALAVAHAFGFAFSGGVLMAAAFVVLSLTVTLALSLGADATGARAKRDDTSSQLLLIPQLLLVLLSTGLAPAESFPDWLQPFVRYQPVSQITDTLRGFADGSVTTASVTASIAWCVGLLTFFGWLAVRAQQRVR